MAKSQSRLNAIRKGLYKLVGINSLSIGIIAPYVEQIHHDAQ